MFVKATGNIGQEYSNQNDKNAPFEGVTTHEVGDGRIEEEYEGMCRKSVYDIMQDLGNGGDIVRNTIGVKEAVNHERYE